MIANIKQLLKPIPLDAYSNYSNCFQKALKQVSSSIQAYIYLTLSKFIITLFFLIINIYQCELSESDSVAVTLLLYELMNLYHQNNFKKEIQNINKLNEIYNFLDSQGYNGQQEPDRYAIQQIVMAFKKTLYALTPELHRESKYILIFAQIIIMRFIVLLTDYPFNFNFLNYFDKVCDQALLNVLFVMILAIFLEYIVIYFFILAIILALPALGCFQIVSRLKKAYQIYKLKQYFNSFPTHQYSGQQDQWIRDEHSCCICMQDYQNQDILLRLPCNDNHIFHEQCIRDWLKISVECPLCRQKLGII